MRPRILFLNRSYWPDSEATGQLLTVLCEGLSDQFDVHVLAGQPNVVSAETDWKSTKKRNGVTIHRVRHATFSKANMFGKGLNFLSFVRACNKRIESLPRPDLIVFETDPFLLPFVADRYRKRTGCLMIGYLQDIYPDVAVALNKVSDNWFVRKLRQRLFSIYKRCERVVVLSRDMKSLLIDSGISDESLSIIPNWADTNAIGPVTEANPFVSENQLDGKFVVMYSGNLGLTQRLEVFVEAAEMLQKDPDIQFLFIGNGARKNTLQKIVVDRGIRNVRFLDYQPLGSLKYSLSAADLHVIPLTATLSQCLMPSKLYGILAAGRPYITNAPPGTELHQITTEQQVGITVAADSPAGIMEAVINAKANPELLHAYRQNARRLAVEQYTQEQSIRRFSEMLDSLLQASTGELSLT